MDSTSISDQNKMIAEFMGWEFKEFELEPSQMHAFYNGSSRWVDDPSYLDKFLPALKYHSCWDYQIKAWRKLAHEVKAWLIGRSEVDKQTYFRLVNEYEEAVFNDQPEKGHEVITEMLDWYNTKLNNS